MDLTKRRKLATAKNESVPFHELSACWENIQNELVALGADGTDKFDPNTLISRRPKKKLELLVHARYFVEPLHNLCEKKIRHIEESRNAEPLTLPDLIGLARRLSAFVRAPPEYNDPTGADGFCVPGYLFPCPDRVAISRSALYHASLMHAIPPEVDFTTDPVKTSIMLMDITTPTKDPTIFFKINNGSWLPYNASKRPFLTGPGKYIVRTFCQAEGFLPSQVSVFNVEVPGPTESEPVGEAVARPTSVVSVVKGEENKAVSSTKLFGGLFLGGINEDEEDEDSSVETSEDSDE